MHVIAHGVWRRNQSHAHIEHTTSERIASTKQQHYRGIKETNGKDYFTLCSWCCTTNSEIEPTDEERVKMKRQHLQEKWRTRQGKRNTTLRFVWEETKKICIISFRFLCWRTTTMFGVRVPRALRVNCNHWFYFTEASANPFPVSRELRFKSFRTHTPTHTHTYK